MPQTACFFLIGAIAISGLPPFNGFVSEWLTYQALLAGFGTTHSLTRLMFPIAGSMLALTAALAAACFVKAFGIPFLAQPRSEAAADAQEASPAMQSAMALLAASCFVLGLGASWFIPVFDPITQQALGVRGQPIADCRTVRLAGGRPRRAARSLRWGSRWCSWPWRVPFGVLVNSAAARRTGRHRTHLGLRPAGVDRRQRIHRHGFLQTACG